MNLVLNIKIMGKFKDESQIMHGKIYENSVQFKEENTTSKVFVKGFLISFPIIAILLAVAIIRIVPKIGKVEKIAISSFLFYAIIIVIILFALLYLHEIIHAICFPKCSKKEIWIYAKGGTLFVYCNECVSKWRFIWICLAPNVLLGVLPYIIGIAMINKVEITTIIILLFISFTMIVSGVGDYYNTYNAITQVPQNGKIFNYGIHSYWVKK